MNTDQTLASALELHRAGRIDEAAEAYQRLLDMEPDNVDGFYGLGTVRMHSGKLKEAAELLNRAFALEPRSPRRNLNRGEDRKKRLFSSTIFRY